MDEKIEINRNEGRTGEGKERGRRNWEAGEKRRMKYLTSHFSG